jgi:hypothetical protein
MKLWANGFLLIIASLLISTSLFAMEAPGDSKSKAKSAGNQPQTTVQTEFSYIIKGYPDKIQYTFNGTYVTCKGSGGRCIAMDFETGVALVDPDGCNMGPTFIGCQKVDGEYWTLIKQTPEVSIWELHEIQQMSLQSLSTKTKSGHTAKP